VKTQILFSLTILPLALFSQLNIKAGYNLSYQSLGELNEILSDHNSFRTWYEDKMGPLHIFHGYQLGVRYRLDDVGFEITYANHLNKTFASGMIEENVEATNSVNFSLNSTSIGIEHYLDDIGIGGTIDRNIFLAKAKLDTDEERLEVLREPGWSSQFYFIYSPKTRNNIGISIKPYAQVHWTKYNLSELENHLNNINIHPPERIITFGLQIIFYNGPKF
jgi:hypothetical protein